MPSKWSQMLEQNLKERFSVWIWIWIWWRQDIGGNLTHLLCKRAQVSSNSHFQYPEELFRIQIVNLHEGEISEETEPIRNSLTNGSVSSPTILFLKICWTVEGEILETTKQVLFRQMKNTSLIVSNSHISKPQINFSKWFNSRRQIVQPSPKEDILIDPNS